MRFLVNSAARDLLLLPLLENAAWRDDVGVGAAVLGWQEVLV